MLEVEMQTAAGLQWVALPGPDAHPGWREARARLEVLERERAPAGRIAEAEDVLRCHEADFGRILREFVLLKGPIQ